MLTETNTQPPKVMTRRQRLLAAVRGAPLDRPPVTAWMHFGSEHLSPRLVAFLHRKFYQTYSWDLMKVMADYRFAVPEDLAFESRAQLQKLRPPGPNAACFRMQIECLKRLKDSVGDDVPLFDSGYDPYQMLLRNIGRDQAENLWRHADITLPFLEGLSDAIISHIAAIKALGIDGYFHSTNAGAAVGTARGMTEEISERFVQPFNIKILDAAHGLVRILHAHGSGIELHRLSGCQFEIIHLSDRDKSNPSLHELGQWSGRCVMGGIDETSFSSVSPQLLAAQIDDAMAQIQGKKFILAPGCIIQPSSSSRSLHFIREYIIQNSSQTALEPVYG